LDLLIRAAHRFRQSIPRGTKDRFPPGAAGIKQAQGFVSDNPVLVIGLAIGVAALIWILVDDDGEDAVSTGT